MNMTLLYFNILIMTVKREMYPFVKILNKVALCIVNMIWKIYGKIIQPYYDLKPNFMIFGHL